MVLLVWYKYYFIQHSRVEVQLSKDDVSRQTVFDY